MQVAGQFEEDFEAAKAMGMGVVEAHEDAKGLERHRISKREHKRHVIEKERQKRAGRDQLSGFIEVDMRAVKEREDCEASRVRRRLAKRALLSDFEVRFRLDEGTIGFTVRNGMMLVV